MIQGHGILSDEELRKAVQSGTITIDPFNPEQVNPTSYDVTLGDQVAVYDEWVYLEPELRGGPEDGRRFRPRDGVLDVKDNKAGKATTFTIDSARGWVIVPGIGYLMHTRERVRTGIYVPVLDGKSTIGRLFVSIHETAGYGDPGFDGQYTLEVTCTHPVRLYPGMKIGQIRFHTIAGHLEKPYSKTGGYKGSQATGPIPSHFQRLFPSSG